LLCAACRLALPEATGIRCARCWRPQSTNDLCPTCRSDPPAFDGLRAAFVYEGVARELVRGLKYQGLTALAEPMGALLAGSVREQALPVDVVVPVPLSGLRHRTRGYNQAEVLAKALGRETGWPVLSRGLVRTRHTAPQARITSAEERRRNVEGAFRVPGVEIDGQRVLVVDDVTTTRATLNACGTALKDGGAAAVFALSFASAD
jgi:ComF family protein